MDSHRLIKWDNIKFFLICCVVLGHIGNFYAGANYPLRCAQFWVYLFHMPAFIFISGLFSKRTVNNRKWGKIVPYIFLFFLMKMLEYFTTAVLNGFYNASVNFFKENGVPWFALALFWFYTITILVQNVSPFYVLIISIFLSVISGYSGSVDSFLVMQRTVVFYPFFYLGYILDIEMLSSALNKIYVKAASAIIMIASLAFVFLRYDNIYYWRSLFRGRYIYSEITDLHNPVWGGLEARFLYYIVAFSFVNHHTYSKF